MSSQLFYVIVILHHITEINNAAGSVGTCDDPSNLYKHTVASSDSLRDCASLWKIFPNIHDEGASKFHQGECAYQCKLELPYTCFKLHAPQTQYDEGLLHIDTFERKISQKWKHVMESSSAHYDAFFDTNIAFWVSSLDEYIAHWQASFDINLEYFGM